MPASGFRQQFFAPEADCTFVTGRVRVTSKIGFNFFDFCFIHYIQLAKKFPIYETQSYFSNEGKCWVRRLFKSYNYLRFRDLISSIDITGIGQGLSNFSIGIKQWMIVITLKKTELSIKLNLKTKLNTIRIALINLL